MTAEFAPVPAPGSEVAPSPPDVRGAYTAFQRVGRRVDHGWPGSATVTEARHDAVDVALELVEFDRLDARRFVEAVREWEAVAGHDHVAPVVGWGKQPRPWLATLLPDATLADRRGAVDLEEALWIGTRLADALAAAHEEGAVHGALAPRRVRLHAAPPGTRAEWVFPRLGEIGVARVRGPSPERRPPERLDGDAPGPAADVYGLGLTLYEALTGESPYVTDGDPDAGPERAIRESAPVPPSTVVPTLPSAVDDLLLDALAKRPAERPAMEAFRERFREGLVAERGGTAGDTGAESEAGTGGVDTDPPNPASSFPFLDGRRADWRAPCPDCGRAVNNTFASFLAHWRDAPRCSGPPEEPPAGASHTPEEWTAVVDRVDAARSIGDQESASGAAPDHPLWAALATDEVVAVGGVRIASSDGSYPWLDYAGRGWRVPCPCCDAAVFNTRAAMKAHWTDAPDCSGPPDAFDTA